MVLEMLEEGLEANNAVEIHTTLLPLDRGYASNVENLMRWKSVPVS